MKLAFCDHLVFIGIYKCLRAWWDVYLRVPADTFDDVRASQTDAFGPEDAA